MQISGWSCEISTFSFLYLIKSCFNFMIAFHSCTKSKNTFLLCATKRSTNSCSFMFFTKIMLLGSFLNFGYIPLARICAKHRTLGSSTYSHDSSDIPLALLYTSWNVFNSDSQLSILSCLFFQIFLIMIKHLRYKS